MTRNQLQSEQTQEKPERKFQVATAAQYRVLMRKPIGQSSAKSSYKKSKQDATDNSNISNLKFRLNTEEEDLVALRTKSQSVKPIDFKQKTQTQMLTQTHTMLKSANKKPKLSTTKK